MFNRGRYNLQRFNLYTIQDTEIAIRELMLEVVNSMVANGENVYVYDYGSERANAGVYASAGDVYSAKLIAELEENVIAASQFELKVSFLEELMANADGSEDCHVKTALLAALNATVEMGSNGHLVISLGEALNATAFVSVDYYIPTISVYAMLDSMVSSSRFDIEYIVLDVTIPPRGMLIIDSDNYVVLLGDKNVIDKHSGEWLDELTRNTFDVQIEGGGVNELTGSILYTPRYL